MITEQDLSGFIGTEHYYKDFLNILLTDGVKYLAENLKCYWLITDISSVYNTDLIAEREKDGFFICRLKINKDDKTALLEICRDIDDGKAVDLLYSQKYEYTDISENYDGDEIKFYLIDNVLMLPREY